MVPLAYPNPQRKWHLDRFSHFCRAHDCNRQTDRQSDHATPPSTICRILAMRSENKRKTEQRNMVATVVIVIVVVSSSLLPHTTTVNCDVLCLTQVKRRKPPQDNGEFVRTRFSQPTRLMICSCSSYDSIWTGVNPTATVRGLDVSRTGRPSIDDERSGGVQNWSSLPRW